MEQTYFTQVNQHVLASLEDLRNERVLEIGCAEGALGAQIKSSADVHWTGIEVIASVAETARSRLDDVHCADIASDELSLAEESFDVLVCADVLEHLVDPWGAIERCLRWLRPGGRVVASIPNINHWSVLVELIRGRFTYEDSGLLDRTHLRFFTLHEVLGLFDGAGLLVQKVESVQCEHPDMERTVMCIDSMRRSLKIENERCAEEARTYQWLVQAHKPARR